MNALKRVQRAGTRYRTIFLILLIILPAIPLLFWGFFNYLPPAMQHAVFQKAGVPAGSEPLSALSRLLATAASFIPTVVAIMALSTLVRLFTLYQKGKIFTIENVSCYRRLGILALISVPAGIIGKSLMSMVLTMHYPAGKKMLSISLSSDDVWEVLVGLIIILIARIMDIGREIQEEQELTV